MNQKQAITINNIITEIDKNCIIKFLNQITFPIAIVDFETFRTIKDKNIVDSIAIDFKHKIFSAAIIVFKKREQLSSKSLNKKKIKLFVKTKLAPAQKLENTDELLNYQQVFFKFLISKLIKNRVKSLILLGSQMELRLFKNFLIYYQNSYYLKRKISKLLKNNKIYDLYDLWNNDNIINIPSEKKSKNQEIGANKKTLLLIRNNNEFQQLLDKYDTSVTNNDIGRIIDQHFSDQICLLESFIPEVVQHNKNDVIIGAIILSIFYSCAKR